MDIGATDRGRGDFRNRRGKLARLFVLIGGLIVIVLTAALIGPYFIDWTSYKSDFEREASRILGRKVTVMGSATAKLLPFPSVTFTDVRVAGQSVAQPAVTVARFSMDAELAPFLRGEVLIFDMRIDKPDIRVGIDPDGTIDWALRPSTPFDPRQITLEKVTVTNGSVDVMHGGSGKTVKFTDINGDIDAKTLAGPWRFQGSLVADGEPVTLDMSTGRAEADGHMRIRVKAVPRDYPIEVQTDGDARLANGKAVYAGQFGLDVHPDKTAIAAAKAARQPTPPDPYRMSGTFTLDNRRLTADQFRFETGPLDNPYTADGNAFVTLGQKPNFGISAKGEQVRFDEAVGGGAPGLTLDERIAALKRVVNDLPQPKIPGKIDVDLPAVLAGDTTIRDVRLSAEPTDGGWTIGSFAATLPGRSTLEAKGYLRSGEDFGFKGSLLLAVKQPSGFAGWVAHDVNDAIRRLPSAGFNADVDLSQRRQAFQNLELILGDARFRGSVESREPADANPSVTVKLNGGKLDVDGLTAFASLFVDQKGQNRLSGGDVDLEVKAGPVSVEGLSASSIDTALRLKKGRLDVDRLSINGLAGADVTATGSLKDFPADPVGNIDATLLSEDLAPLTALLVKRFPDNVVLRAFADRAASFQGLLSDAQINVVASAAKNKSGATSIGASANGKAGGSIFTFSLSGDGRRNAPEEGKFSLTASVVNNDAAPVYALLGLPGLPLGLAGRLEADLSSKGVFATGAATDLKVHGDGLDGSFTGNVRWTDAGLSATGKANLDAKDLGPWLMTGGLSLPGMGLGLPVKLAGDLDYSNGVATIKALNGSFAGGALSGTVTGQIKNGVPALGGTLSADVLDLSIPAAMVLGQQSLQPQHGGWSQTPFLSNAAPAFDADLDLSVKALFAGALEVQNARIKASLDDSGLHVANVTGSLDGGALTGLADLKNNNGTGLFSSQFHLSGAALGDVLPATGLGGRTDISASVTSSGKSLDAMVGALAGSGTAAFQHFSIPNLNPQALKAILAAADAFGHEVDARKALAMALPLATAGKFEAPDIQAAFTVAEGVVHVPPLRLEAPAATVNADVSADLKDGTVNTEGNIVYAAGNDALVGSEPSLGFTVSGAFSRARVSYDAVPLAQFLTQRALEREQARVEALQAALLEKQRLHREVDYYADLDRIRAEQEEERRKAAEEAARKATEEARRQAAEADSRKTNEQERKADEPYPDEPPAPPQKPVPTPKEPAKPAPKQPSQGAATLKDLPGVGDFLKQHDFDFGARKQ